MRPKAAVERRGVRWIRFVLVAVAAVLAQTTLVRVLSIRGARPDLIVAMLATFALGATPAEGFVAGAVLGLGRDLFSAEPFGLSTGLFAVLGYAVASRRSRVYAEHVLTRMSVALVCAVASSAASVGVLAAQGSAPSVGMAAERVGISAAGTAVLAGLVGALVWRRPRWFGLRRRPEFQDV